VDPVDQAVLDENEKLRAELEALKAQLGKTETPEGE
jgi:regulator of replication initiation timing